MSPVSHSALLLQRLLRVIPSERLRRRYWNRRAADIDATYGSSHADYELLASIIDRLGADRILDVGCGAGRLFPLYQQVGVSSVVGLDVAQSAIDVARHRYGQEDYQFLVGTVHSLDYPTGYFDLAVSNRVLSAVSPSRIDSDIARICSLSSAVYISELTGRDYAGPSPYWFKHDDYPGRFARSGFALLESGELMGGDWMLFVRDPSAA
jgi:SAM-dependent methyltransferase